jgi:hypothetical protein
MRRSLLWHVAAVLPVLLVMARDLSLAAWSSARIHVIVRAAPAAKVHPHPDGSRMHHNRSELNT